MIHLGIDLGTSSCKVCALDENGRVAAAVSEGYPTHSPRAGWAEQDPEDWFSALRAAAARLFGGGIPKKGVASVTLTSAAHIGVLLDDAGRPVRKALLWSDQRSKEEAERLRRKHGGFILARAGNNVSTSWTLSHLAWIREREPEVFQSMRRLCLSKDYLLYRLTGEWKTDPATAVSAMLFDTVEGKWSGELCAMIGIDPAILPAVVPAGSPAGRITPEAAENFGLPSGVPVVNGTLDSATETYGAGAAAAGDLVIRIGTAGGIHVLKNDPSPDPKLLTYPYPAFGLFYSQAGTNSAGSAAAWAVCAAGGKRSPEDYDAFSEAAAKAPAGSRGLLFHPYLSGERTPYWEPSLRGTFSGVSFGHGREHFARAVLEGIAFSLYDAFLAVADKASKAGIVRVVGGGAADRLLAEILSTVFGRELLALERIDSAYGAALFGLRSLGGEVPEGAPAVSGRLVRPNQADRAVYTEAFDDYRKSCPHLLAMYRERNP